MLLKPEFYINQEKRRSEHRKKCVEAANAFVKECKKKNVDVVVFGSLVKKDSFFRENSDVDLCILSDLTQAFSENDIDQIALNIFVPLGINYDLWHIKNLKSSVVDSVLKEGVDHVI